MAILIWLVGLITGFGLALLIGMAQSGKVNFKWFHWAIMAVWYLGLLFVIGFVATSFDEGEPQAAGMATLIFGGVYLIISVLLYRFAYLKPSGKVKAA